MTMTAAQDINRLIAQESDALRAIITLINGHAELSAWPDALREAFLAAFFLASLPSIEDSKADDGRFMIGLGGVKYQFQGDNSRLAERIRSDLPRCLRFRAGRYLASEIGKIG